MSAAEVLAGVHPQWARFVQGDAELAALFGAGAARALGGGPFAPGPRRLFEALRYCAPADCHTVIVTAAPSRAAHAGAPVACGLGHSCLPGAPPPPELAALARSVVESLGAGAPAGLVARVEGAGGRAGLQDLRFWAAQGVLFLGQALSGPLGPGPAHDWGRFAARVLELLCAGPAPPAIVPWGGPELGAELAAAHPGAVLLGPAPFREASARLAARGLRPVAWLEVPTLAACDGGCSGNGTAQARAGYGACVLTGPLQGLEAWGPVPALELELVDPAAPAAGFRAVAGRPAQPSNNRGEYLGACYVMLALLRAGLAAPVEIVSDSRLLIQTLEKWLPQRRQKGTAAQLKNYDLVVVADALYQALGRPVLTHERSHRRAPPAPPGAPESRAHLVWRANDCADRLATRGKAASGRAVSAPFWLPC